MKIRKSKTKTTKEKHDNKNKDNRKATKGNMNTK